MKGKSIAMIVVALVVGAALGSAYVKQKPQEAAPVAAPEVRKAPPFALESLDGKGRMNLMAILKNKPVVLDFWASWCPNCERDMPKNLQPLHEKYKDRVEIIGVNFQDNLEEARKFAEDHKLTFRLGAGGDSVAALYGVGIASTKVLIDQNGNIIDQFAADLDEARLLKFLNEGK